MQKFGVSEKDMQGTIDRSNVKRGEDNVLKIMNIIMMMTRKRNCKIPPTKEMFPINCNINKATIVTDIALAGPVYENNLFELITLSTFRATQYISSCNLPSINKDRWKDSSL